MPTFIHSCTYKNILRDVACISWTRWHTHTRNLQLVQVEAGTPVVFLSRELVWITKTLSQQPSVLFPEERIPLPVGDTATVFFCCRASAGGEGIVLRPGPWETV